MQVVLLIMRAAELPHKGRGIKAENIKGGQQRRKHADDIIYRTLAIGSRQDLVFREETRERRDTGNGDTTQEEGNTRHRHELAQSAHLPHILLSAHRVDDTAGPKK